MRVSGRVCVKKESGDPLHTEENGVERRVGVEVV